MVDIQRRRLRRLFAFGKGIVAMDAAHRPITPESPWPNRTTSGVVLAPGVLARSPRVPELLRADGMLLGVRADLGVEQLTGDARTLVTSGCDGLTERLSRQRTQGAEFAVWHVPPAGTGHRGASHALAVNGQGAARFARTCHELGLVPLIRIGRPGDGADGTQATALMSLCMHLDEYDVELDAVVLVAAARHGRPLAEGPLAVLPDRLGGLALTVDVFTPGDAADAVRAARSARPRWPVTFYLGREATAPAFTAGPTRAALHAVR